jgi:hypothetical protein
MCDTVNPDEHLKKIRNMHTHCNITTLKKASLITKISAQYTTCAKFYDYLTRRIKHNFTKPSFQIHNPNLKLWM